MFIATVRSNPETLARSSIETEQSQTSACSPGMYGAIPYRYPSHLGIVIIVPKRRASRCQLCGYLSENVLRLPKLEHSGLAVHLGYRR